MTELKTCPFCGGEAYQPGLKVICLKCSASTVDYSMTMGKYEKEYDMARLVWNTRTPALAVPEGYKLVKIEPTDEVINRMYEICDGYNNKYYEDLYKAMIAASPTPEVGNVV